MSINVNLTIREAILLLSGGEVSNTLCEQIIKAIEDKCGGGGIVANSTGTLNLTLKSLPIHNRISVIKAIRVATGWGLKESKDFCDAVTGSLDLLNGVYCGGTPNTLTNLKGVVEALNKELVSLGCETHVDGW